MATVLETRVDNLEAILGQFIVSTGSALNRLEREMVSFKNEMLAFKDEMLEFKNEMRAFKDEMLEFKNEMRAFKDEMRAFKDEMQEDRRKMNRQWGELANKLGTFVEDISAPNIPFIAEKRFGLTMREYLGVRVQRWHGTDKSKETEIDVLAVYPDAVVVNEAKSSPRIESVNRFLEHLADFFDYFPEYKGRKIIPVFSSLYITDDLVAYMSGKGVYAMGMREGTMDILNPPGR